MTSGGARNRSGPGADPQSGRSDRRGFQPQSLPSEGYDGKVPTFVLPRMDVLRWVYEETSKYQIVDEEASKIFRRREMKLWREVWTYPQACMWSIERWRWNSVAMWVRTFVVCEGSEATAADKGSLHRFADQIGLTPAGLKENGWAIAHDEVSEQCGRGDTETKKSKSSRDRMKLVSGDGG